MVPTKLIFMILLGTFAQSISGATASQGMLQLAEGEGTLAVKGVVVGPQQIPWTRGFWALERSERRGSLGVEIVRFEASRYGGESFVIEQGLPGLERLRVMRCGGGRCEAQKVEQKSKVEFDLDLGALHVRVRDHGEACQEGGQGRCLYFLPSWALKGLGKSPLGGLPQFPKILLVRQTHGALEFFNAENGQLYHELDFGKDYFLDHGGPVSDVNFDDRGRMALQFQRGAMLIDWAQDQLFVGDREGRLLQSVGGLGAGAFAEMKVVLAPQNQETLLIGNRYVVQRKQILMYHSSYFTPFKLLETIPSISGDYRMARRISLGAVGEEGANLARVDGDGLWNFSLLNPLGPEKVTEKSAVSQDPSMLQKAVLGGKYFFRNSGSGWEKLDVLAAKNQWEPLPLSTGWAKVHFAGSSFFGSRKAPTAGGGGEDCEWVRMDLPTTERPDGREDGFLRFSCDGEFEASSSPDGVVMALGYQKRRQSTPGFSELGESLEISWKVWWL